MEWQGGSWRCDLQPDAYGAFGAATRAAEELSSESLSARRLSDHDLVRFWPNYYFVEHELSGSVMASALYSHEIWIV